MKTVFAVIGFFVSVLWILGVMHIGHFALIYSPDQIEFSHAKCEARGEG